MARLTLKFKDKTLKQYQFTNDITIGRIPANDIVIDNTAVSGKHAAIKVIDDNFILKDFGSLNGVFVNENKVKERDLKDGDRILIGKHIIEFDHGPGGILIGSTGQEDQEFSGMTMCLDTKKYKELLEGTKPSLPEKPVSKPLEKGKPPLRGKKVKVITESLSTGRPTEIFLEKNINIIGKKSDSDIVIHGFLCGEVAAIIERRKEKFIIRHVGGFSKTRVNGKAVQNARPLADGDIIKIGANRLVFREVL